MLELKLAEYDLETGKFKGFLYVGDNFLFGGDCILIAGLNLDRLREDPEYYGLDIDLNNISIYPLDEKDPLARFDGLFDGRTYGNGRFVLIYGEERFEDDVMETIIRVGVVKDNQFILRYPECFEDWSHHKYLGNLHENPELWEKLK